MQLKLRRCVIRTWQWGDEQSLVQHANNRNVWINLRDLFPHPYTLHDAKQWIQAATGEHPVTHFAITVDETAVGGIGFTLQDDVFRRSAEIGFWLGEAFWGRGIMTEAVKAMTEFIFAHFDISRVYAKVFESNPASMRVFEKAGYTCETRLKKSVTKNGQTLDEFLYAIVR